MNDRQREIRELEELLSKYRLTRPIAPDIQEHVLESKQRVFKRIMKSLGRFSLLSGIAAFLYFMLKKLGVSLTGFKVFIIGVAAVTLPVGVFYSVKQIQSLQAHRPVELRILPPSISRTGERKWDSIRLRIVLDDRSEIESAAEASAEMVPPDLGRVLREGGGFKVEFARQGEGKVVARWKGLSAEIPVSYRGAEGPGALSPLERLQERYTHVEKVYLNDGSIVYGVLVDTRGAAIKLITPEGTLDIDKTDINKVEYSVKVKK